MEKQELRKIYKQRRSDLSLSEKDRLEDLILIQFQTLHLQIPSKIMTYSPIEKFNEYDPNLIIEYCRFKNPHQILHYPVINTIKNIIEAVEVHNDTAFITNAKTIDEPVDGEGIPAENLELILVPLLAFDEAGNRVGYGKGYYDRFLKVCRADTVKIGFSFFCAENEISDVNVFDIKLDYCITPQQTYQFIK